MNLQEKNKADGKGYTPVQLVTLKALKQSSFQELAKSMAYHP
jgi:hypothetical protein